MLTINGVRRTDTVYKNETYLFEEKELGNLQRHFQMQRPQNAKPACLVKNKEADFLKRI